MKIGAQFYTIREFCQDLGSFSQSLKKVADIGYRYVQISGTCEYDAQWLKQELDKNGLQCVLTHTPAAKLQANLNDVMSDHTVFGCNHIGLGYYPFNEEENLERFVETYLPIARQIHENGKYMMYHNHAQEFSKEGDLLIMEHLAQRFPAKLLGFTLDTYWVQAGGGDPAQWLEKLSGRVPCIHLKDYAYDRFSAEKKMAVIGEGNINFDRVFEAAEKAGTQYMLVEQDNCNGEDPFECLSRSYAYLKSKGF